MRLVQSSFHAGVVRSKPPNQLILNELPSDDPFLDSVFEIDCRIHDVVTRFYEKCNRVTKFPGAHFFSDTRNEIVF